jgi:hypothetical protein
MRAFAQAGLRVKVCCAWSADFYRKYWLDNVADLVG